MKPQVMVLSTLQGLLGKRNLKEQSDMADINAMLVRLAGQYCPIVVITHSPHDPKKKRGYGTVMQDANCGVTIHFERLKHGTGEVIHATVDEKYEYGKFDFTLELDTENTPSKNGQSVVKRPRRVRFQCYGLPKGCGKELVLGKIKADSVAPSVREIAEETGIPKSTVQRILQDRKNGTENGTVMGQPRQSKKTRGTKVGHPVGQEG